MKTVYCNLVKKNTGKTCGTKVLLLDCRISTTFPHAHPEKFKAGLNIAKHCPKCGFITGYTDSSVMEDPEPAWKEIKRKHDVLVQILRQSKQPKQLSLF